MSVPRRIDIGYRPIEIEVSPSLPNDEDGHCDTGRHAIVVRAQMDDRDLAVTVLHEMLHHLVHRAGGHTAMGMDEATEERVVSALAAGITEAVRRNGKAVDWFVACVRG